MSCWYFPLFDRRFCLRPLSSRFCNQLDWSSDLHDLRSWSLHHYSRSCFL
jgi:hypothetical protein